MLKLYAGRENIDKERFIYSGVAEQLAGNDEVLVLVPNQYTLVAEEQTMKHLGTDCLYNLEILSMNRLGLRVLTEQGIEHTDMLDKYGRFMLLNNIIKSHRDELEIYGGTAGKLTFTSMVNDFISDFKQQNCTREELRNMLTGQDNMLSRKIAELELILNDYEKSIEGKYTDSEDYIAKYVEAIKTSEYVLGRHIWVYGYDSITPKFRSALIELSRRAASVSFIVNRAYWGLDDLLINQLSRDAASAGVDVSCEEIDEKLWGRQASEETATAETIGRIERGLFNDELSEAERTDNAGFGPEGLKIVRAANPYYEAESAAAYVYYLIRDCGYRMRDIQVIANDEGRMQPVVQRTFAEYGLPVFLDKPRDITDTAAVNFIINQLAFFRKYGGTDNLLSMLKSGLAGVEADEIESLENYSRRFRIRGNMWLSPFKYGGDRYDDEELAELEELRARIAEPMLRLKNIIGIGSDNGSRRVSDFIEEYRKYLEDEWKLSDAVTRLAEQQATLGMHDEAQRMVQSYEAAIDLLDQIDEIMGEEALDLAEFTDIYLSGLSEIEVGVIPPAADGLSMGTMIRTRPRPARAVVILGANEGTLPMQPSSEGLFSVDEKSYFRESGFAIGELDDIKMKEENSAMYRVMSLPTERLYISWSMTDVDGEEATQSPVIDSLVELFPRIETDGLIEKDIVSAGWSENMINSPAEALRHLINHIKDRNTPEKMDSLTEALISWYEGRDAGRLRKLLEAAQNENVIPALGRNRAAELFNRRDGSLVLSASAIGNYFDCPFRYYVDRGLRPDEEREYVSDARSVGDVYHECLMKVAREIMADREYGIRLAECSDYELEKTVSAELDRIADDYRGGVYVSADNEKFRLNRIKEICTRAVRALAYQLSADSVVSADFEEEFGRTGKFRPIEMNIDGTRVYVEGKIDRADILSDGERVRIIDYKTGTDKLDIFRMAQGYKMQLMIYMISATTGELEPAGMFYFNIHDPIANLTGKSNPSEEDAKEGPEYKLNGVYIDEEGVLESMPANVLAGTGNKLSTEEYAELRSAVQDRIKEVATGISEGRIGIRPVRNGGRLACSYCDYRAICRRDREYAGNSAREIKGKPRNRKKSD